MTPPRVLTVDPADPAAGSSALAEAAAVLRAGGLVAFPTETVYGLGANARDAAAVGRVFAAKGRPSDNPLIVHLADADALEGVAAAVTPLARELAARWWPGPLTLVLEAAPGLPEAVTAGLSTVAVRVPGHPVALALLRAAGVPLAAPSANRSGRPSPTTAAHVVADLGDAVDLVLDAGPCRVGVESTVVDARGATPVVLREGAVTREDLGVAAAADPADPGTGQPDPALLAASPGTRHAHYQPDCTVRVAEPGRAATLAAELAAGGQRVGLLAREAGTAPVWTLGRFDDAEALARLLFAALRQAERLGLDVVVVEAVAESGIGRAVMDRLRRAAAGPTAAS